MINQKDINNQIEHNAALVRQYANNVLIRLNTNGNSFLKECLDREVVLLKNAMKDGYLLSTKKKRMAKDAADDWK